MKFVLLSLAALAAAAPQRVGVHTFSDEEIVTTFLDNPRLLPPSTYAVLRAHAERSVQKALSKRQFPGLATLSLTNVVTTLQTAGALLSSFMPTATGAPTATVPDLQHSPGDAFPGAKRTKVRYGPYRIPPISERNLDSDLLLVRGMAHTFQIGGKRPCEGDCRLLSVTGSMEYADGKPAENADGAWFHHALIFATGPTVTPLCNSTYPIDELFMGGNEKSLIPYSLGNESTILSAYHLGAQDKLILSTQLMNMQDREKWVWLTMDFEWLPAAEAPNHRKSRFIWASISSSTAGTCSTGTNPWGVSNITAEMRPKADVMEESSTPWTSNVEGTILATGGHMHDGGVGIDIFLNDKVICASEPIYSNNTGGMGGHGGGEHGNSDIPHIQGQSRCKYPNGVQLKVGDRTWIRARYNFKQHPGMKDKDGNLDEIMGITGLLVAW
ncbi:hypothetical protein EJ06DRAFT_560306 [Trichodelitschia bisporula]|uniref:Uncharacterized protein n=1 Tax=Trichodelitschia bisporula TaxID=703511 RepID=A0A6G1HID3_9PEZI|nr:hypothetical protein EJ06DRAFT_560306 [Trichodelitschia bisporula]